jgi:hypothetical protein
MDWTENGTAQAGKRSEVLHITSIRDAGSLLLWRCRNREELVIAAEDF